MDMFEHAKAAHAAGLCVVPPRGNGSKAPMVAWTRYQYERPTIEDLERWYSNPNQTGIGAVLGKPSGNAELFEFDDVDSYEQLRNLAGAAGEGDLVERIEAGYLETSPNGIHWLYRCETIEGNRKLAQRLKSDDERGTTGDTVKVLIETRGNGGYAVLAPTHGSVHPSGRPYKLIRGSYATIATITPAERERLFSLAQSLDAMPRTEVTPAVVMPDSHLSTVAERPGDYFNRTRTWADVLTKHGWTVHFEHGKVTYWTRPGRERVTSATTNYADTDLLKVFSTSTPFQTTRTYSKFGAYALLEHGGSFSNAARAIRAEMMPKPPPSRPLTLLNGNGSIGASNDVAKPIVDGPAQERGRLRLLETVDVLNMPPPEWLIQGVLVQNSLAVVWGAPASAKSFLVLDWALCVGSGTWWKGHEVAGAGSVIYVAAEGAAGLGKRIKAWSKANNVKGLERVKWLPMSVNLLDPEQAAEFEAVVMEEKPSLIVVDTLARSMAGADENAAKDMGRLIDTLDAIRGRSGATAVLIHHATKEGSTARGSGSLKGAVDTEIEVKKEGTSVAVFCRKQKDAEEFLGISLQLVVEQTSCVLVMSQMGRETKAENGVISHAVRDVFRETYSETGASSAQLRDAIMEVTGCSKATAHRRINDLVSEGFIRNTATLRYPFYEPGENFLSSHESSVSRSVSIRLNPSSHRLTQSPPLGGDASETGEMNHENDHYVQALFGHDDDDEGGFNL